MPGAAVPPAEMDLPADKKVCYGPPAFQVDLEPFASVQGFLLKGVGRARRLNALHVPLGAVKMFLGTGN